MGYSAFIRQTAFEHYCNISAANHWPSLEDVRVIMRTDVDACASLATKTVEKWSVDDHWTERRNKIMAEAIVKQDEELVGRIAGSAARYASLIDDAYGTLFTDDKLDVEGFKNIGDALRVLGSSQSQLTSLLEIVGNVNQGDNVASIKLAVNAVFEILRDDPQVGPVLKGRETKIRRALEKRLAQTPEHEAGGFVTN